MIPYVTVTNVTDGPLVIKVSTDDEVVVSLKYSLKAVICHVGTPDRGHYYTYAKHDREWFRCDDKKVTWIKESLVNPSLHTKQAYILVYTL
jgi:ubiquitin C-terminal hydrolase